MQPKSKSMLVLLLVLVIGFILGSLTSGALQNRRLDRFRHMSPEHRFREAIENIVEPTAEQRKQLKKIFEEHAQKMGEIQEEKEAEIFKVVDSLRLAINTILNEDQLKRFHKQMDQTRDRFMIMHLDRLQRALGLTEEQHEKIKEILEKHQQFLPDRFPGRRMRPPKPEMREMLIKIDKEIEAVLTPEQVEKYQRHKMERGRGSGRFLFRGDNRRMDRNRRHEYFY